MCPPPFSELRCRTCWRGHSYGSLDKRSHCGATAVELVRNLPFKALGKLFRERCLFGETAAKPLKVRKAAAAATAGH